AAGPVAGDVRVPGVDPPVPEHDRSGRKAVDRDADRPVEQRIAAGLGLVEGPAPDRDRDPAVVAPRRPALHEAPRAVAAERRGDLRVAEELEHADRPEPRLPEIRSEERRV